MPKLTLVISRPCLEVTRTGFLLEVYRQLPEHIQKLADKNFALFKTNPRHPSLGFKKKGGVYTAEIGRSYRAIARERNGDYFWFWIGTHEDYNNFKL